MPKGRTSIPRACRYCEGGFTATNGAQFYCSHFCLFWAKVEYAPAPQCWTWKAAFFDDGYGAFYRSRAHRVAWEMSHRGSVPGGMVICHSCDNPACVNPAHMWAGSIKDNKDDSCRKLRHGFGERNGRAKLTEGDVGLILASPLNGPQLAEILGVHRSQVNRVRRGESWWRR